MANFKGILDMYVEQEIEVVVLLKGTSPDTIEIHGKITGMGDDYIELLDNSFKDESAGIIPIENLLMVVPLYKKEGSE